MVPVSITVHRLEKEIKTLYSELGVPYREMQDENNLRIHTDKLYRANKITHDDYVFLFTRVLLNNFCFNMEMEYLGPKAMSGFTFYCPKKDKMYYGAGANFPKFAKNRLRDFTPVFDFYGEADYKDDALVIHDVEKWEAEEWQLDWKNEMLESGIKTFFSNRLQINGEPFGSFSIFSEESKEFGRAEINFLQAILNPIKEQLYSLHNGMILSLQDPATRFVV